MVVYKCNKCGFMDVNIGIQAHLVINKCGGGEGYMLKESKLKDYTTSMTDKEYYKLLNKLSTDAINNRGKKQIVKEETTVEADGKTYTADGFEVEQKQTCEPCTVPKKVKK